MIPPDVIADADRKHARGRGIFDQFVDGVTDHDANCTDPDCVREHESCGVTLLAEVMMEGINDTTDPDVQAARVVDVILALSYAVVRTATRKPLDRRTETNPHA